MAKITFKQKNADEMEKTSVEAAIDGKVFLTIDNNGLELNTEPLHGEIKKLFFFLKKNKNVIFKKITNN